MLGLVLAFIAACGSKPKECDAVRPLVAEVKAALSQLDVAGVQAPGEKLLAALKNVSNPELSILKTRTEQLLETARKAQAPAADPAESQRIVQDLDFYTKAFDNAWGHATEVCN